MSAALPVLVARDGATAFLISTTVLLPVHPRMEGPTDEFRAAGLTIRFQRDAGQKATGFSVDSGRVRGNTFTRR